MGFAKQNVQSIRQPVRHQFVTVRKEGMRTQAIHVQTVLEFTDRTFGNVAALNIEPLIDSASKATHIRHHEADICAAQLRDFESAQTGQSEKSLIALIRST